MSAAAAAVLGTVMGVVEEDGHLTVSVELNDVGLVLVEELAVAAEEAEREVLAAIDTRRAAHRARAASAIRASIERA